jgi:hypothetical protein
MTSWGMTNLGMTSLGMTSWGMTSWELDPKILPAPRCGFRFEFHLPVPVLSTAKGAASHPTSGFHFLSRLY